jgi:exodeoxyribonuclease V alpha subunit
MNTQSLSNTGVITETIRGIVDRVTIHKSQGSEFGAVIIPVLTHHFKILFRNLIYTGLTRARKLAVLVGTRKALAMAVKNQDTSQRQTYLKELLQ